MTASGVQRIRDVPPDELRPGPTVPVGINSHDHKLWWSRVRLIEHPLFDIEELETGDSGD